MPPFRTDYDTNRAYLVQGSLLNKIGVTFNAPMGRGSGGDSHGGAFSGLIQGFIGIATITGADNSCPVDLDDLNGATDAPCTPKDLYKCKVRVYDGAQGVWSEYPEELRLDASLYFKNRKHEGPIPAFEVGDEVPVMHDPVHGWLVPLNGPPEEQPISEYGYGPGDKDVVNINDRFETAACVVQWNAGAGWLHHWSSVSSTIVPRSPDENATMCGITTFPAIKGTTVRLSVTIPDELPVDVKIYNARLRLWFAGRKYVGPNGNTGFGGTTVPTWTLGGEANYLYKDGPTTSPQGEVILIDVDEKDNPPLIVWTCFATWELTLTTIDNSSSSSSSSSSTSSSSSSSSSSRSSSSSSSSSTSSSSNSSSSKSISSSSSTSSSHSISSSSSLSSLSSSSASSQSDSTTLVCLTLVTAVRCDPVDGSIAEVCTREVCFPVAYVGPETCGACEDEASSDSSASSTSPSSASSPSSQSGCTTIVVNSTNDDGIDQVAVNLTVDCEGCGCDFMEIRLYIDGVQQDIDTLHFCSPAYTTVMFGTGIASGTHTIRIEVDILNCDSVVAEYPYTTSY